MDYVTRQFINLTKRLLRDSRKAAASLGIDLHHIKNAIQSIDKHTRANQQQEQPKIEVVALLHEPEGAEAKRKAEYDRTQRRDRIRLVAEWLTFFAVVFYGYMAVRQWREQISARHQTQLVLKATDTANEITKASLVDVERAFVSISPSEVYPNNITVGQGGANSHVRVRFRWSNSGSTPTKNMRYHISRKWSQQPLPKDFSFPDIRAIAPRTGRLEPPIFRAVLGPKGETDATIGPIPDAVMLAMSQGLTHIYVWGWAKYNDVFQDTREHEIQFCYEWAPEKLNLGEGHPETRTTFYSCETHNCYDDECRAEK
ncbi:MAG: hypothetical protein ABSA78_21060 [Candidatus Sulfotelmatobacter sp.]|jgi:hypothetical protein